MWARGGSGGRRPALARLPACAGLTNSSWLTKRPGLPWNAWSIQCIRGSADSSGLGKLEILVRLEASDQLTRGPDIDKPPRAVFFVHGVFVGLAHEADGTQLRLGEVVEGSRKPPHLAAVEPHAAGVLLPAPDHLFFFFTAALLPHLPPHPPTGNNQNTAD